MYIYIYIHTGVYGGSFQELSSGTQPALGFQSPQLLAPGLVRPRGCSPAPVAGTDPTTHTHTCTCVQLARTPLVPPVANQPAMASPSGDADASGSHPCRPPGPPVSPGPSDGQLLRSRPPGSQATPPACRLVQPDLYQCSRPRLHAHTHRTASTRAPVTWHSDPHSDHPIPPPNREYLTQEKAWKLITR